LGLWVGVMTKPPKSAKLALEGVMPNVITPDRQDMLIRLMLAILGGALLVVGWYRFFN